MRTCLHLLTMRGRDCHCPHDDKCRRCHPQYAVTMESKVAHLENEKAALKKNVTSLESKMGAMESTAAQHAAALKVMFGKVCACVC